MSESKKSNLIVRSLAGLRDWTDARLPIVQAWDRAVHEVGVVTDRQAGDICNFSRVFHQPVSLLISPFHKLVSAVRISLSLRA